MTKHAIGSKKTERSTPTQTTTETPLLSVDEVLRAVKTEKVSAAVTIGVQPTLLEYATQVAGKRERSTWLRKNIIENLQRKNEEKLEQKAKENTTYDL